MELLSLLLLLLFPSLPCAFSTSLLPISPNLRRSQTSLSMTAGDKRLGENSKLSGLLRKSGTGGIVHQRGHAAAGAGNNAPLGEMGSLSAGPGSPTAGAQIKRPARGSWPGQGEVAPDRSWPQVPRIPEPEAVSPLWRPGRRDLGPGASSGGAAGTRAPRRAEHYSDLSICQAKPEKTSWPVPSLEPDKIPPELQPDIPEASAEFHSLWIRSRPAQLYAKASRCKWDHGCFSGCHAWASPRSA